MRDIQPPDELERRCEELHRQREELQRVIDEQTATVRRLTLELGLEQALRFSFELLEQFEDDPAMVDLVSNDQREIMEIFGHPAEGYTLLRRLSVEHHHRMMANTRHTDSRRRVQRIRQEWVTQRERFDGNKYGFAGMIAEREGVELKTVYYVWLKWLK